MRRLLAVAAVAAALAAPAHAYYRECGGMVDMECRGRVCPTDCWDRDCFVWIDVRHDSNTAQCIGNIAPIG